MSIGKHPIKRWETAIPAAVWLMLTSAALSCARMILRAGTPTPRLLLFSMKMAARCSRAALIAWKHQNKFPRA